MLPPVVAARLRRFRIPLVLVALLAIFHLASAQVFEPTARRYERAVGELSKVGLGEQAAGGAAVLPPRVYRLMADNSRPAAEVDRAGTSGRLVASFLESTTQLMTECGMEVTSTDPGTVIPAAREAEIRVEIRARAAYGEVVEFLDRLARAGKLIQVSRMSLLPDSPGQLEVQLTLSQFVFKLGAEKS
jgi:hypothetical protein